VPVHSKRSWTLTSKPFAEGFHDLALVLILRIRFTTGLHEQNNSIE
jgi:hypothetical protein